MTISRRSFALCSLCALAAPSIARAVPADASLTAPYKALSGEPYPVAGVDLTRIKPEFLRRQVQDSEIARREPPGTIVVDPAKHFLYLVQPGGTAIRYGVGVGRSGFGWSGDATVNSKQAWPDWYPPREMFGRQPHLRRTLRRMPLGIGMPGGVGNPLGARALYLWQDNRDTLYRIHGTLEPWTIGSNVSSGCIRMINQDVIDLYERVEPGARVVVLGAPQGVIAGGGGSGAVGADGLPPLHMIVRDPESLARGLW